MARGSSFLLQVQRGDMFALAVLHLFSNMPSAACLTNSARPRVRCEAAVRNRWKEHFRPHTERGGFAAYFSNSMHIKHGMLCVGCIRAWRTTIGIRILHSVSLVVNVSGERRLCRGKVVKLQIATCETVMD
uniref:Uncharacterized protein n=1 Tax=Branchiostoma floridae TaxID=7739 RepID=C3ZAB4_BRAFL|eukprot:XP_002594496.1 hypothetical protein BRAFLDRAFT_87688 [Branchiostoma floridae]